VRKRQNTSRPSQRSRNKINCGLHANPASEAKQKWRRAQLHILFRQHKPVSLQEQITSAFITSALGDVAQ